MLSCPPGSRGSWFRSLPIAVGLLGLTAVQPALADPGSAGTTAPAVGQAPSSEPAAGARDAGAPENTELGPREPASESEVPATASSGAASPAQLPAAAGASTPPSGASPATALTPPPKKDDRLQRLGVAGGMMLGQFYTLTVSIATGALVLCWHDPHDSTCLLPETRAAWYDLYIPVAGPFVALRHEEVRDHLGYVLSLLALGTAQSVGFVLVSAALLTWPSEDGAVGFVVAPELTKNRQGLSVAGRF